MEQRLREKSQHWHEQVDQVASELQKDSGLRTVENQKIQAEMELWSEKAEQEIKSATKEVTSKLQEDVHSWTIERQRFQADANLWRQEGEQAIKSVAKQAEEKLQEASVVKAQLTELHENFCNETEGLQDECISKIIEAGNEVQAELFKILDAQCPPEEKAHQKDEVDSQQQDSLEDTQCPELIGDVNSALAEQRAEASEVYHRMNVLQRELKGHSIAPPPFCPNLAWSGEEVEEQLPIDVAGAVISEIRGTFGQGPAWPSRAPPRLERLMASTSRRAFPALAHPSSSSSNWGQTATPSEPDHTSVPVLSLAHRPSCESGSGNVVPDLHQLGKGEMWAHSVEAKESGSSSSQLQRPHSASASSRRSRKPTSMPSLMADSALGGERDRQIAGALQKLARGTPENVRDSGDGAASARWRNSLRGPVNDITCAPGSIQSRCRLGLQNALQHAQEIDLDY